MEKKEIFTETNNWINLLPYYSDTHFFKQTMKFILIDKEALDVSTLLCIFLGQKTQDINNKV